MALKGTAKELAEILGISERRVNQIVQEGNVFDRSEDGSYDIPNCVDAYYKNKYLVNADDEAKKLKYEAELKKQKAEEAEMKNAIARGEYIKREEVTADLQRLFIILKRSILGLSKTVAAEVAPHVDAITARRIENNIQERTVDALNQISQDGKYKK